MTRSGGPAVVVGAIDIGSNSVYLTLAKFDGDRIVYLQKVKDSARLAAELGPDGRLSEQAMSRARVRLARYASTETMNAPQLVAAISPSSRAKTRATEARDSGDHTWMTVVHTTGGRAVTKPVRLPRTTLAAVKAMVEPRTSAVL